ncbi:MAG: hypothetical protein WCH61_07255, partial [bacterium]
VVFKLILGGVLVPQKTYAAMTGESGQLSLEIYNFSGEAKTGKIDFTGKGRLEGLPNTVTLPPNGKTALALRYTAGPGTESLIAFTGVFNGKRVSTLRAPIWRLAAAKARNFAFDQPVRWRAGSPGNLDITYDAQEKAVKFKLEFASAQPGEADATPEYVLNFPEESLRGAVGLSFEIRTRKDAPPTNGFASRFIGVQDKGVDEIILYPLPTSEWQSRFVYFPADASPYFDPARVTRLKIGLALSKKGDAFWLRNVKVIYK